MQHNAIGKKCNFFVNTSVTEYVTQQKYIYVYILESRIIGVTPRVVMTWTELVQLVIKLHMFSLELQQH